MGSMWHQTYNPATQDALTRNLARQYAPHSVRVIGVNPAWVDTEAPAQMAAQLQVRHPSPRCNACAPGRRSILHPCWHGSPPFRVVVPATDGQVPMCTRQRVLHHAVYSCWLLIYLSLYSLCFLLVQKTEEEVVTAAAKLHAMGRISTADEQVCVIAVVCLLA
jgi:NAD(P)-dependent dehydrogenase (short-subunit alcohol dehydrogenase family)